VDSSAGVPLDVSRVKVSVEYGLCEMMNVEAMGVFVEQVAPSVDKWFPDLAELESVLPAGTIDHSTEPLYPEVPKWGEPVRGARTRYASVIKALADKYPDENLLLVTHGEGVGSSVACFGTGMEVYDVEYCAYSVLERQPQAGEEVDGESLLVLLTDRSGPTTGLHYLTPRQTTPAE
jgi:hypothetical protein